MFEDEVIADSEDEGSFPDVTAGAVSHSSIVEDSFDLESGRGSFKQPEHSNAQFKLTDASVISAFSSIPRRDLAPPGALKSTDQSNISSFPPKLDQAASSSDPPPRPRPRPKPRPIKRPVNTVTDVPAAVSSSIADASTTASMFGNPSLLGINARDESAIGDYSLTLAERAKTRVRNSKGTPSPRVTSVSSSSKPETMSGGKQKSVPKPAAVPLDDEVIDISTDDELFKPKLKSKAKRQEVADARDETAQVSKAPIAPQEPLFYPSDSQMTMTTIPMFTSSILPPSDPPPPSTIHGSTPPTHVRKRKRPSVQPLSPDLENEGAHKDGDLDIGGDSRMMPPPPPPFFASSSSSLSITIPARPLKIIEGDSELSDIGDTIVVKPSKKKVKKVDGDKKQASKNKRKSSEAHLDTETAAEATASTEVNARKPKKAKSKQTMEVVIKTSGKATATKGVFKSKELILDSDDEADPLALSASTSTWAVDTPLPPPPVAPVVTSARPESPLSSMHESEPEPPAPKNGKKSGKANAKDKGKQPAKRDKRRVVDSDDELGGADQAIVATKRTASKKKKKANVVLEDESSSAAIPSSSKSSLPPASETDIPTEPVEELDVNTSKRDTEPELAVKENIRPSTDMSYLSKPAPSLSSASKTPGVSRAFSISRMKSTPMSELIRRVNSQPNSPFRTPKSTPSTAYSPLLKSSRSMLSRIAPLHPTRKPPPPPLPPVPKVKERKTKKMLEMEERWEDELSESVDGWACMEESEREVLRRRKKDVEMGWCED
ncbi:hypothetical protein HWV62_39952 [Athelia sp. TMB]|nr:hypothetical protein HWV62_39952 [Athelia sp. TMB]